MPDDQEPSRLAALRRTQLLDSPPESGFDRLARMASVLLHAPVALVSLIDEERQFFKSSVGLSEPLQSRRETPLTHSFCKHVVAMRAPLVVADAREHPMLRENPATQEFGVVAYAGVPLMVEGEAIGAFCVVDVEPRSWTSQEVAVLRDIAESVVSEIELRAALRASHEQHALLGALVESVGDAVVAVDENRRFIVVNEAARRIFSTTARVGSRLDEGWVHRHRSLRSDGSPMSASDGALARALNGERVDGLVCTLQGPDRLETTWVEGSGRPIRNAEGRVVAAVCVYRDVTESRRQNEVHRTVIRNLPRGSAVLFDQHLRVLAADGELLERLGIDRDTAVGKHIREISTEANAERMESEFRRTLQGESLEDEFERQGSTLFMRTTPVRDGTGRIVAGLALAHDVTTERDASKAALAAERQFRLMFENAPIGIALVALDGRLLRVNHALGEMLGYSAEELQRATFQELTHPDDLEPDLSLVDQLLRDEIHRYRLAKRYLHKSGRIVDVILHVSLARDEAKEPLYFVSQIEDLTERKKLESQLLVRDRMASLGTLAAGVAHEINNPLTYLIGNLEHISEQLEHLGGLSPSGNLRELSEAVSEARVGADRVRKIVRALKTFSRPEEVDCFPQNVHRVLDNAISMTEGEVRQRAKLVRDFRDVPPVEADEARLTQIFINLLVNAAHAIPEGHAPDNQIRIATRVEGQRVVVTVSDTGSGIAPEVLPRIFDPFFTTKPVGVGTGLGLSITHGIVSEFGGTISVDSTLGRGTTFRVELPACEVVHVPPPPLSAPAQSSPATEPPQAILIVDDDRLVATGLARALRAEHEVTIASTAREALAMFRQRSFSVVLCDLMMPDMSGMDLHSVVLAEHGEALARRFVFVTGGAFTQAAREFLDRVPNPRFEKPVQTKNLREFLRVFRPPR